MLAAGVTAMCLKVLAPVAAHQVPPPEAFSPAPCTQPAPAPAYRYDEMHGFTVTTRMLAPGETVAAFPEFGARMVRPGDKLVLVGASGGVRIEREVVAMQAARPSQRLFVKTTDGEIISVRYEEVTP
jgi:flagella basal body P-ring formation protein FlgA